MNARTLVLLGVLTLVAVTAIALQAMKPAGDAAGPFASIGAPVDGTAQSAQPQHPRISDAANILDP